MRRIRTSQLVRGACAVAAVAAMSAATVAVAHADPGDPPCEGIVGLLCKVVPMAPSLEGDIDLTVDQPVDPAVLPPEERRPADICARGCM